MTFKWWLPVEPADELPSLPTILPFAVSQHDFMCSQALQRSRDLVSFTRRLLAIGSEERVMAYLAHQFEEHGCKVEEINAVFAATLVLLARGSEVK